MKTIEDKKWFPMRSTYGRELKVKEILDQMGIESYVPMTYQTVESNGERHKQFVPAIHNLIFIHVSEDIIKSLKNSNPLLSSLRFMIKKKKFEKDKKAEILVIPTKQMDNFILVTKNHENDITYLQNKVLTFKRDQKVKVVDGIFEGVEGEIIRIHKNKRVVISIDNIPMVMIDFVPNSYLELDSGEMEGL